MGSFTYITAVTPALVVVLAVLSTARTSEPMNPEDKGPPRIVSRIQKQQLVKAGDRIRLSCPVHADPPPIFEWTKDSNVIHGGWERHRVREDTLYVRDLELDDTGVYVCRATNGFGNVELTYLVFVSPDANATASSPADFDEEFFQELYGRGEAPVFIRPDQMQDPLVVQSPGSTANLRCRVTGKPRPDILWFKDGKMISENFRALQHSEAGNGGMRSLLRLTEISQTDAGLYTCRAFNKAGMINFTYTVQISETSAGPATQKDSIDPTLDNINKHGILMPYVVIAVVALITTGILFTGSVIIATYCRMMRHDRQLRDEHDRTSTPLMNSSVLPLSTPHATFQTCHVAPSRHQYEHQYAVLETQPALGLFFSEKGEHGSDKLFLFDNRCGRSSTLERGDRSNCQDYRELTRNQERTRNDEKREIDRTNESRKNSGTRTMYSRHEWAPPPDVAINFPARGTVESPTKTGLHFCRNSFCDVSDINVRQQNNVNVYSSSSIGSSCLQLKHTYDKC